MTAITSVSLIVSLRLDRMCKGKCVRIQLKTVLRISRLFGSPEFPRQRRLVGRGPHLEVQYADHHRFQRFYDATRFGQREAILNPGAQ